MSEDDPSGGFEEYGDDAVAAPPSHEAMAHLVNLINDAVKSDLEATRLEAEATAKRTAHTKMICEAIPEAMRQLQLSEFRTDSGFRVKIKKDLIVSLSEDRRAEGIKWLESKGHGDVVKRELNVALGKGQEELERKIAESIQTNFPTAPLSAKDSVHHQTLKALLKKLALEGMVIPEIFKPLEVAKAEITM